jgi:hypothetical protein
LNRDENTPAIDFIATQADSNATNELAACRQKSLDFAARAQCDAIIDFINVKGDFAGQSHCLLPNKAVNDCSQRGVIRLCGSDRSGAKQAGGKQKVFHG